MPVIRDRSGKVKITTLLWLVVLAVVGYLAIEVGGVYLRRYSLADTMTDQLAYAGQLSEETIRDQLVTKIKGMNLPPEASRVRMRHVSNRTIELSVRYTETVNLLYTTKQIPISITKRRSY